MKSTTSIMKTARLAGLLYFLQIPLGIFGMVWIPETLYSDNDVSSTVVEILNNEMVFRLSIVSSILCALLTAATAYYISKVLRPVNKIHANAMLILTLIAAPLGMINELNNVAILHTAKSGMYTTDPELTELFISLHEYGIHILGIFFGLWLLPMGLLVIKSGYIPAVIGYFLVLACIGYVLDFIFYFLYPPAAGVSNFTWIGELMMVLWLLIKGVNKKKYEVFIA